MVVYVLLLNFIKITYMKKWAVIRDDVVIDLVVWDGETEWQYPFPHDEMVEITEKKNIGIGWYWENGAWHVPESTSTVGWHHDYEIRITAPTALMDVETGVLIHFVKNNLPVVVEGDTTHLYCNEILPEHQPLISSFSEQGVVVEYTKPYLMNNNTKEIHRRSDKVAACNAHLIVNRTLLDEVEMFQALTDGADGCGHCLPEYNNNEGSHLDSGFSEQYPPEEK